MANPQKENGFVGIASEIVEALATMKTPMSHYEWKILMFLFRKTYGWGKKEDVISLTQFAEGTNIPKPHVCRAIKKMVVRGIITQTGNGYYVEYSFQKDYEKWESLPKQVTKKPLPKEVTLFAELPKQVTTITQTGNESLPKQVPTIDTIDNNNKKHLAKISKPPNPIKEIMAYFYNRYFETFGEKYVANFGKDGAIFKDILTVLPVDRTRELIDSFFQSEDEFIKKTGYTVGVFKSQINKLKSPLKQQDELLRKAGLLREPKLRENNYR